MRYNHSQQDLITPRPPLTNSENIFAATRFEHFATAVIDKVYKLLETPILVVDKENKIIAANQSRWQGKQLDIIDTLLLPPYIEIPLGMGSEVGQLRIYQETQDENTIHLVRKIVQLAVDQIYLVEQLPGSHKLKDKFLYNLLSGFISDVSLIEIQAQQLDLDLTLPRAVILVDASSYLIDKVDEEQYPIGNSQIQRRISSVIKCIMDFFSLPDDTICTHMGQGEIAVLKATDTKNLANWAEKLSPSAVPSWANLSALKRASEVLLADLMQALQMPFTISIGRHHPGITGLAHSYQDARAALTLGLRFYGANRIHCLHELGIAAFAGMSDERIKSDLAAHILSPLQYEPDLIATLHTFFENNCSPTAASTVLSIHRNTLNYRLNKITSLIGLDPRRFDDAVQLRLALLLHPN